MVCRNCGAKIDDKATSCPYCNAMQYDASEAEYMNNLYKMNDTMDNLDDEANKYVFSSVLKSAAIVVICIAAAVLIGVFWGFVKYKINNNSSSERKKIHQSIEWYDENISKLDEVYEKGDYEAAKDLMRDYSGTSAVISKWSHYSFIMLYDNLYDRVADIYKKSDKLDEYDFDTLFRGSLDLEYFSKNIKTSYMGRYYLACSDEEKKIVDEWISYADDFLKNKAGIAEEDLDSMIPKIYYDGYYDYKIGRDYESKYYEKYQER